MLQEITQKQINTAVNQAFPALRDWLEEAQEALYRVLWVGNLSYIEGSSPAVAAQVQPIGPDVHTLARLQALTTAAYRDSWLECHVSGAAEETAGLPTPPGWSDIS